MTFYNAGSHSFRRLENVHTSHESASSQSSSRKKPIEVYSFIDPLCPECWALEPIIKKLQTEYGKYIKLVHLIGGQLSALNRCNGKWNSRHDHRDLAKKWERTANRSGMSCDGDIWLESPISTPYAAAIAIKAAEFQGKKAGVRFLRKLREFLFLNKQDITKTDVLLECGKLANLDLAEFENDLHSDRAVRAFQCDIKISLEMEVNKCPTLVFFNDNVEEAGIKVTDSYPYDIYVDVMTEISTKKLIPSPPPPLEEFLEKHQFVATEEIAVVYDMTYEDVELEMKKLALMQTVERVPVKYGTFWRYIK